MGFKWKYLPVDDDLNSYYDVHTTDPVSVTYKKGCAHPKEDATAFSFMDKRSDDLDVYEGTCCRLCGKILEIHPRD